MSRSPYSTFCPNYELDTALVYYIVIVTYIVMSVFVISIILEANTEMFTFVKKKTAILNTFFDDFAKLTGYFIF